MPGAGRLMRLLWLPLLLFLSLPGTASEAVAGEPASCPGMDKGTLRLRTDWTVPLLKSRSGAKAIFLQSTRDPGNDDNDMNVNSDGSPRAYHLLDPEGRRYALNDMRSGGVRVWENGVELTENARYYEVFNKFVRDNGDFGLTESTYNPRADTAYRLGDDFGNELDPSRRSLLAAIPQSHATNADFGILQQGAPTAHGPRAFDPGKFACLTCKIETECKVCFPRNIIASVEGKPCIRRTGRYAGFLVNKTGLDDLAGNRPDPENAEDKTCGTATNLDPEKLPGLVLPEGSIGPDGDATLRAAQGDVVVGYNPITRMWAFGIVSDGGPPGRLGEASIAFNRTLRYGYKNGAALARPLAYHGGLLSSDYQPKRPIGLLLLPGSIERFRKRGKPASHGYDFSPRTVATKAKAAFLGWAGTTDMSAARSKYLDCLAQLPPN